MFSKCSIIGLNLSHVKNDISRAVLEGVAFESRLIMESFSKMGIRIDEIRANGGGTKSGLWLQIRSNILNKKIHVPKFKDSGLLGAIILASVGASFFKNIENAVDYLIEIEKTVYPQNKDIIETYNKHFHVYKKIYPALLPIYDDIKSL
jgi:xylulokinase